MEDTQKSNNELEPWEKQRVNFEIAKKSYPELFEREPMIDSDDILRRVGIDDVFPKRPTGYLKLWPQDFIVEEIAKDGSLRTVEKEITQTEKNEEGETIYADLVKIGSSTLEVVEELSNLLNIEIKNIGYAGIKDKAALTGQAISLRRLKDKNELKNINQPNFFLKNITRGKGVIANGNLLGNRFTITVRSPETINKNYVLELVSKVKQRGFWNFFYLQRFGTPRLISHLLGLLILKTQYEEVVKTFIAFTTQRELPYFKNIRDKTNNVWGNWVKIVNLLENFPIHFRLELKMLNHLKENRNDFLGALHQIPDQIRLWMYAYDSYLFNKKLSQLIKTGSVPFALPLITSFNKRDWEMYLPFLNVDEIRLPSPAFKDFPFVRVKSRTWPTSHPVDIHEVDIKDNMAFFSFTLHKGAYATSLLTNFFTLTTGLPIIEGIPEEEVDIKEILGLGTLGPTLERFGEFLDDLKTMREN